MTGNQTTILLLVALLALVFWLYNSKKLPGVVSAITGTTPDGSPLASSGISDTGINSLPALGTLQVIGNGNSPLPIVNTSAIANERLFLHYDPSTNKVFYNQNP